MAARSTSVLTESPPPSYRSRPSTPTGFGDEEAAFSADTSSSSLGTLAESSRPTYFPRNRNYDSLFRNPQLPMKAVKYRFRQVSMNAMTLVSEIGPMYHISVGFNCFIPSAFVTTIREGGSENGTFIADFQTGVIRDSSEVVCIRGQERYIASVFKDVSLSWKQKGRGLSKLVHWRFDEISLYRPIQDLYWDVSPNSNLKLCYMSNEVPRTKATLLARFESCGRLRNGRDYLTTLEVTPEGHREGVLDHILVSALILERLWLTPDAGKR
ncbi:hypothetical protein L218DRAFT_1081759 [Marasmius fiardii PR-910]|nr:hypothetical protein L218DRAFT_1081759 [Marasmius fiardii PR-910]